MQAYHEFFDRMLLNLKQHDTNITRMTQVGYQNWLAIPGGRTGFAYSMAFAQRQRFRVELYIDVGDKTMNKLTFETLESQREEIESATGTSLSWERLDDARASRIALHTSGSIDYSPERLEELSNWAIEGVLKFRGTFGEHIKQL